MSTIRATYIQHGSSSVPNITLNASGEVILASGIISSGTFSFTSGTASAPGIAVSGDADTGIYSPAANKIAVTTSGTERLIVDDTGKVGLGSSAPNCQLTNTGTTSLGTNAWPTSAIGRSSGRAIIGNEGQLILWNETVGAGNSGQLYIGTKSGSSSTDLGYARISAGTENASNLASFFKLETMNSSGTLSTGLYLDSSQRVGIGTTSAVNKLVVSEGGAFGFEFDTGGGYFLCYNRSGSAYADLITRSASVQFRIENSEKARIDSSGRLLVGTTTEQGGNLLQTFGNLGLTKTASGNQINFYGTAIEFVNRNGTARAMQFYVGANGGSPVAELSSAGTWTNASDIKNKENIQDIAYGIETVKALIPRQYDVKSNGKHAIGFVAQEVQPIIPEVIHESFVEATQETHLGLDYGSLAAVLTKALQEAVTKIETLEAEVAALKAQ